MKIYIQIQRFLNSQDSNIHINLLTKFYIYQCLADISETDKLIIWDYRNTKDLEYSQILGKRVGSYNSLMSKYWSVWHK